MLDNSVAGGITAGMLPFDSLVKESMEEASLPEDIIRRHAKSVGAISYFFRCSHWICERHPSIEHQLSSGQPRGIFNLKSSTCHDIYESYNRISNMRFPSSRYVYDLAVPPSLTPEEQELFRPKPLDGEVEAFEVSPYTTAPYRLREFDLQQNHHAVTSIVRSALTNAQGAV
jgi:hypothetical protein